MAKYLSLERLTEYDGLIKAEISEGDAQSLASSKTYTNEEIAKITNGTTTVKNAEHATSADSATTSSNADNLGGQAPSYYAKASDIPTGALAEKDIVSESDLDSALAEKVNAASEGNHSHLNKEVLDGITSDKVSAWDSAEENAKAYTDSIASGKANTGHNHDDDYDEKGAAGNALTEAKSYTDSKTSGMATTTVVDNKISAHNTSSTAHNDIRDLISSLSTKVNNFLDVDDTTTDQLSEVLELIENNKGTLDSLISGKVNTSDIVDNLETSSATKVLSANQGVALKALIDALQAVVDGKAESSDLTSHTGNTSNPHNVTKAQVGLGNVENKSSEAIREEITKANVTTALGYTPYTPTEVNNLLGEKAAQTSLDSHTGNADIHVTSENKTQWNTAYNHSQEAHAPSNAQANVIESIKVNGAAQTITDKAVDITVPTKASDINAAEITHTHAISEITNLETTLANAASAISANTSSIGSHNDRIGLLETAVSEIEEITSADIQALFSK